MAIFSALTLVYNSDKRRRRGERTKFSEWKEDVVGREPDSGRNSIRKENIFPCAKCTLTTPIAMAIRIDGHILWFSLPMDNRNAKKRDKIRWSAAYTHWSKLVHSWSDSASRITFWTKNSAFLHSLLLADFVANVANLVKWRSLTSDRQALFSASNDQNNETQTKAD